MNSGLPEDLAEPVDDASPSHAGATRPLETTMSTRACFLASFIFLFAAGCASSTLSEGVAAGDALTEKAPSEPAARRSSDAPKPSEPVPARVVDAPEAASEAKPPIVLPEKELFATCAAKASRDDCRDCCAALGGASGLEECGRDAACLTKAPAEDCRSTDCSTGETCSKCLMTWSCLPAGIKC
jgi:hypothetical protein